MVLEKISKDIENILPNIISCSKIDLNVGIPGNMKLLKDYKLKVR